MILRQMIVLAIAAFLVGAVATSENEDRGGIALTWVIFFVLGYFFHL